ncbi:unnamed protein product [Brugia pahangi]|uniref:CUB domain-containing protein n=1 Tax=Brugia pahangi TaxID=6280 RepID=A0A0N4TII0_BRUPA|nr:unnamed protein product [Brugia pahangi]
MAIGTESNRLDPCKCGSLNFGIDVATGDIKSPGYPTNYCSNLNCKYEIDAIPGQSIHFSIVSFETERRHDSLEIHQTFIFANTQYSACIATLFGKDIGWPSFASSISSGFILKFVTDSTETFGGFHARFSRVNITSASILSNSCSKFFHEATNEDKTLPSPPTNFTYFAGCAYMLNTNAGHGIKLDLKSLAYKAKFIIYETENYQVPPADHTTTPLFESVGLMEAPPKEIISRTNSILIQIKIIQPELFPATAHSKFLFEAQFSRTDSPCKCFSRSYTIRIDRPTILSSPGFPLEYCDKLDCETELRLHKHAIDSTHHNAIILEIHSFNLEHGSDLVHFLDRSKHSSRYLISRTGELSASRNRFFTFCGERTVLRMITDSTVANNGFNMIISAIQKESDCRCKGEAQPLKFSPSAGTVSFNSAVGCGFLDCFFQFNRPVTALDTDRIRLVVNITYTFKNGEEEFLEVFININNYNIIPSHLNERDVNYYACQNIFEPALTQSGTEVVTNDTPMMIWYHLASDINKNTAQINTSGVEIFTDLLRSTAETMTVYFKTDITNKGFVLYYTAGPFLFILEHQHFQVQIERSEEKVCRLS